MLRDPNVTGLFDSEAVARAVDMLLAEDVGVTRARERSEFDRACRRSDGRLVLFGSGNLGRQTLARLRQDGIEPLAFSDNSRGNWGHDIDGVRVLSPADAATRYGASALFVVTIWNDRQRFAETSEQLTTLGCGDVLASTSLRWKYGNEIPEFPFFFLDLPSRIHESISDVVQGSQVWADDRSRHEYLAQLRLRFLGDVRGLPAPVPEQYSHRGRFIPHRNEVFVDCGAFDGDTVRSFVSAWDDNFAAIYAVEPDPGSFLRLKAYLGSLPPETSRRIEALQVAVGEESGSVPFHADGTMGAAIAADGDVTVPCGTLDDMFANEAVTYVKMDIEGYEPAALRGSLRLASRCRPVLAVCGYHAQDHLWSIPLFLHEQLEDYSLLLRPHRPDGWDLIVYAIPNERLRPRNSAGGWL